MTQQPQQTPYIGSKISLISKLDIRYEGILYTVDSQEATIALSKVKSFGTEDRPTLHPVPGRDEVYEYIIFKASDIKDLIVCDTPKPVPNMGGLPYDPAILSVSQAPIEPKSHSSSEQVAQSVERTHSSVEQLPQPVAPKVHPASRNQYPQRGYHHQQQGGYYNNQQQQHYRQGGRQQARPPARTNQPREKLKFDSDYDFEKANEQFKETIGDITKDLDAKLNIEGENEKASSVKEERLNESNTAADDNEQYYDKSSSFFDSISCEALEKQEGKNTRPDWRKERMTNQETFGPSAVRSLGYRRGGGRGYGGPRGNRGGNQRYNGYVNSYGRTTYTSNNRRNVAPNNRADGGGADF